MLFDVTAVLIASVSLTGVTGAVVVPENVAAVPTAVTRPVEASMSPAVLTDALSAASALRTVEPSSIDTASIVTAPIDAASIKTVGFRAARNLAEVSSNLPPVQSTAPTRVASDLLPRLAGRALLDQLALLPTGDVATFVRAHPEAVTGLLADPPSAVSVGQWWRLTPPDARISLMRAAPELVGNLDGIAASVRDTSNRLFLRDTIETAEDGLDELGRAERADAEQRLHMLHEIEESLVTEPGQPARSLLSVDTTWPGRAAVVVGDLDTADYVSYMVPGMFFTVDGQIVDWTVISQDLYDEQVSWVKQLGGTDEQLDGASLAVVSWIGYQTPGIADIASLDLAHDGAKYLSSAVDGLQATRTSDEPYVTLVTHSYGSTATLMALQAGTIEVDSLVIIGSPGSAAQSVNDIGMPADRVFVGEAAWDPVVNSAFFGSDPGSAAFGAEEMRVSGGTDPITGEALAAASGHLGYFDAGTEAMRNMALVGLGRGDLVTGATEGPPVKQLAARR